MKEGIDSDKRDGGDGVTGKSREGRLGVILVWGVLRSFERVLYFIMGRWVRSTSVYVESSIIFILRAGKVLW